MQLFRKTFVLENIKNINTGFIENFIETTGFKPLRWAVVAIEEKENKFSVEAVIIK